MPLFFSGGVFARSSACGSRMLRSEFELMQSCHVSFLKGDCGSPIFRVVENENENEIPSIHSILSYGMFVTDDDFKMPKSDNIRLERGTHIGTIESLMGYKNCSEYDHDGINRRLRIDPRGSKQIETGKIMGIDARILPDSADIYNINQAQFETRLDKMDLLECSRDYKNNSVFYLSIISPATIHKNVQLKFQIMF